MNEKPDWLPSLLITSGGFFTVLYFINMFNELQASHEQSSGFLSAFSGLALLLSGPLIIPLFMGGVVAILGVISFWKQHLGLAVAALILAFVLLNWVGSILSAVGAIVGVFFWRKRAVDRE
ncbi:hypothetical protein JNUCC1_01445 [Lentibacillus sp. JNUCC-1]|uniref:hypothetical protein n=1 Tax=Lentibacillus sp. JNUCC-1 TaxID=2654513 RepID=UPI0012E8E007|nr:hypothetical protein [Lentibacillus sp. JNUCC-1]MUV37639.1 hypothetical protein [Lentibacillus sp. JNUCC-1]